MYLKMGLGKTITTVSLIAATLSSARTFEAAPLIPPKHPNPTNGESNLSADHFAGRVWGMPPPSTSTPSVSTTKAKGKEAKAQDLAEELYARACRIKCKSRATLVICPLSTVANWEEQLREHWNGPVRVSGGSGSSTGADGAGTQTTLPAMFTNNANADAEGLAPDDGNTVLQKKGGTVLRAYVYHGNARRPDPTFLADFDVVITTYSTLASEFSKQTRSLEDGEDVGTDSGNEAKPPRTSKLGKRKRLGCNGTEATSPLQSVHWFRVVLDEAQ